MNKIFKRIIAQFLVLATILILSSCGQSAENQENTIDISNPITSQPKESNRTDDLDNVIYLIKRVTASGYLKSFGERYKLPNESADKVHWGNSPGEGTCTYDERGNMLSKTWKGIYGSSDAPFSQTISWTYDDANRCLSETQLFEGDASEQDTLILWSYDSHGNELTCEYYVSGELVSSIENEYVYDSHGNVINRVCVNKPVPSNSSKIETTYSRIFDENNLILSEEVKTVWYEGDKKMDTLESTVWTYNEFGKVLTETTMQGANKTEHIYTRNKNGDILTHTIKRNGFEEIDNYNYDLRGKLASVVYSSGNMTIYSYNEQGKMIHKERIKGDGSISDVSDYDYFANGNLAQEVSYSSNSITYTRKYDEHENLIKISVDNALADPKHQHYELVFEYEVLKLSA